MPTETFAITESVFCRLSVLFCTLRHQTPELGISPNGYADPDFMGWEVKQYGVSDFTSYRAKSPVTLMTPEPTGGLYRDEGVDAFLRRYGYADKSGKSTRGSHIGEIEPAVEKVVN